MLHEFHSVGPVVLELHPIQKQLKGTLYLRFEKRFLVMKFFNDSQLYTKNNISSSQKI